MWFVLRIYLFPADAVCTVLAGYAVIQYSTAASAIYAKYKLHGFEYPPGNRLTVVFLEDGNDSSE